MQIQKDALLRVIKAAREARRQAEILRQLTAGGIGEVPMDNIYGWLTDALFHMSNEPDGPNYDAHFQYFEDMLFDTGKPDGDVADWIIAEARKEAPEIPKPNLISRDKFNEMIEKSGCGYRCKATPEGEWK